MSILRNQIQAAEFARVVWRATPDAETPLEKILTPEYWAHVARDLHLNDIIELAPAGGAYYAELLVRSLAPRVRVDLLRVIQFDKKETSSPAPGAFYVKHRGPRGWSVLAKTAGSGPDEVVAQDLSTSKDAEDWISEQVTAAV